MAQKSFLKFIVYNMAMAKAAMVFFLLSLPLQLGRHFWLPESYLWGLPIDYLAPTVYLSSILLLVWFLLAARRQRPNIRYAAIWIAAALINILFSQDARLAFFSWIWLSQLPVLVWLVGNSRRQLKSILPPIISFWLVLESVFAAGQVWRQASLGGWGWWFGERYFSIITPGIAKINLGGRFWLRPYGTFPHPNALAGFSLVALLLGLALSSRRWKNFLYLPAVFLILVTASHTIIFLAMASYLLAAGRRRWLGLGLLPLLVGLPIGFQSWRRRWQLAQAALAMARHWPVFGAGLGNFLPQLARFWPRRQISSLWIQPVHNIYLFWLSQTGLAGILLAGVYGLRRSLASGKFFRLACLIVVLSGLLDHYWLTSQQNLLLLGILLGLAVKPDAEPSSA